MKTSPDEATLKEIREAVKARGLLAVARDVQVDRRSLASVLVGASREGTRAVVIANWRAKK